METQLNDLNKESKKVGLKKHLSKLKDCTKEEVLKRIKSEWRCFGRHKEILCNKNISMSLRRRVLINVFYIPTMTHGSETWSTAKHLESKLQAAQRAMERQMLKISLRDKV